MYQRSTETLPTATHKTYTAAVPPLRRLILHRPRSDTPTHYCTGSCVTWCKPTNCVDLAPHCFSFVPVGADNPSWFCGNDLGFCRKWSHTQRRCIELNITCVVSRVDHQLLDWDDRSRATLSKTKAVVRNSAFFHWTTMETKKRMKI